LTILKGLMHQQLITGWRNQIRTSCIQISPDWESDI